MSYCGFLLQRHGASSGFEWRRHRSVRRVAANILNRQTRTADKGGPPAWGLAESPGPHYLKNLTYDETKEIADIRNSWTVNDNPFLDNNLYCVKNRCLYSLKNSCD
jgi:hypothetical protein